MKIRSLSYSLAFALTASLAAACGGSDVQPETPPPAEPPPAPVEPAKPAPAETQAAVTPPAPAEPPKEVAPAPKPLRERLVGVWVMEWSGDVKTAGEAEAKKKAGKDEKKLADLLKKAEEAAGKEKVEHTGDMMIRSQGDKTLSKVKYEVVKEEGNTITLKRVGKDEVSKKDAPAGEVVITFKDDNTFEVKDPGEKDAAKAKLLVFKKGAASAGMATPATPAAPATPATPAKPADKAAPAATPAAKGGTK